MATAWQDLKDRIHRTRGAMRRLEDMPRRMRLSGYEGGRRLLILLLVVALTMPAPVAAQVRSDSALARALVEHGRVDQAIRDTMVRKLQAGEQLDSAFGMRMMAIDSANTTWLKGVVAREGWPGRSAVGPEGAQAAFLIVQHATHDTAFQASALALMRQGVTSGEVPGQAVAMLADRIAVQRGQRQQYGTQAKLTDGRVVLDPIEDSAHVDERRAALGMPPLGVYVRMLDSMYTARPKSQ